MALTIMFFSSSVTVVYFTPSALLRVMRSRRFVHLSLFCSPKYIHEKFCQLSIRGPRLVLDGCKKYNGIEESLQHVQIFWDTFRGIELKRYLGILERIFDFRRNFSDSACNRLFYRVYISWDFLNFSSISHFVRKKF